jgi:Tfp pilus assembly protein PilF
VRGAGDPPTSSRVSQPRLVGLLCYLALARPRGLHARDTLVALLWPDHDEARGRKALRNALHGLRQQVGDGVIISAGDQLVGLDTNRITCDAHELERGNWRDDPLSNVPFDVHDVEPLQGFHVRGTAAFEHWLSNERDRLRTLLRRRAPAAAGPPNTVAPNPRRESPDAWVMHARGHYLFLRTAHGGPPDELLRSRDYFERALAIDPTFAPALAGLSNFHAVAARRGVLTPFREHFAEAIRLSEATLALDATIAIPHVHFGVQALYLDDDIQRAEREFRTAVAKDPTYGEGHRFLGVLLALTGQRRESLQAMEDAVALEPDIAHLLSSLASARYGVGDVSGAEAALRRVLLLEPRHGPARERLLLLLEHEGRLVEALEERERHPAMDDAAVFRAALSKGEAAYHACARDAMQRDVERLLPRVLNPDPTRVDDIFAPPVVRLVQLYARLGDWKRVRSWRLQAQSERPVLARWFDALPELQPERS